MSQENVELVRRSIEDLISGEGEFDTEGMLAKMPDEDLLDPQVEWDASEVPVLDIAGVYRGIEDVRRYWRQWFAAWQILHFDYRLVDAGDRVVALFDHQRMQGRSTGIEVPVPEYATVSTFRNGLVVHWKLYMSQSEALEAVGLSEQDAHADS
jgi:SnoaL-like domain